MMLCKSPYMRGLMAFPCGQCLCCRINRRRLWVHRMLLEQAVSPASCFVTLTYSDEHLPEGGTLVPDHLRDWLKRLREAASPVRVRYFAVGEYGERTWRPHYHAALFGLGLGAVSLIERTWKFGHVHVGDLTDRSASYVAGYVCKKMTQKMDPRLCGRMPEFSRMSRRPGIGALAVPSVSTALTSYGGARRIAMDRDVPLTLRHGRRLLPLGRYLRLKLREEAGVQSSFQESRHCAERTDEMRRLREKVGHIAFAVAKPFVEHQRILQAETKFAIWKKKDVI